MLTTTVQFSGTNSPVYIAEYEENYIISIPDLAFSMQVDNSLGGEEIVDELIIHLFTLLDEDESEHAAKAILSVIRTEQGDNNGNKR
ncbi:MAG: YueH family protein [Jeotgalicoccus sp.]